MECHIARCLLRRVVQCQATEGASGGGPQQQRLSEVDRLQQQIAPPDALVAAAETRAELAVPAEEQAGSERGSSHGGPAVHDQRVDGRRGAVGLVADQADPPAGPGKADQLGGGLAGGLEDAAKADAMPKRRRAQPPSPARRRRSGPRRAWGACRGWWR